MKLHISSYLDSILLVKLSRRILRGNRTPNPIKRQSKGNRFAKTQRWPLIWEYQWPAPSWEESQIGHKLMINIYQMPLEYIYQ